jgi:hypothetical protein
MFKIIFDSDFNGMFDSGENPNDVFVNYFKDKYSTTFLFHYLHEHTSRPFNSYDFNNPKSYEELENILVSNNNVLYCLYSGYENILYGNTKIKNVFFITWPTYLLHYSYYGMVKVYNKPIQEINIETNFDKLFLNQNNKPRYHRGMLLDEMSRNDLFKFGKISWFSDYTKLAGNIGKKYEFKNWIEENLIIDNLNIWPRKNNSSITEYDGYYTEEFLKYNCLLNVVNETLCNNEDIFITEKTFKNVLISQPFICFSSKNHNKSLTNFGFVLYDEIIDYSFDSENELENRINRIIKNLNSLKNENYGFLHKKIKDKLDYNKSRSIQIIKKDEYIPKELVTLYKNNKDVFHQNIGNNKVPEFLPKCFENY